MKKKDILKRYELNKLDDNTVFIQSRDFNFSYTKADSVVKDELKGQYRYFGGLQCGYEEGSNEYKILEKWLCEIAENSLNY
jgi:hypothetical protein